MSLPTVTNEGLRSGQSNSAKPFLLWDLSKVTLSCRIGKGHKDGSPQFSFTGPAKKKIPQCIQTEVSPGIYQMWIYLINFQTMIDDPRGHLSTPLHLRTWYSVLGFSVASPSPTTLMNIFCTIVASGGRCGPGSKYGGQNKFGNPIPTVLWLSCCF